MIWPGPGGDSSWAPEDYRLPPRRAGPPERAGRKGPRLRHPVPGERGRPGAPSSPRERLGASNRPQYSWLRFFMGCLPILNSSAPPLRHLPAKPGKDRRLRARSGSPAKPHSRKMNSFMFNRTRQRSASRSGAPLGGRHCEGEASDCAPPAQSPALWPTRREGWPGRQGPGQKVQAAGLVPRAWDPAAGPTGMPASAWDSGSGPASRTIRRAILRL